ncbi:MAG: hypothetical protein ACLU9S_08040 [Oscillospiraceae bacterium]
MDIGEHPGGYVRDILVMTNCDSVRGVQGQRAGAGVLRTLPGIRGWPIRRCSSTI